MSFEFFVGLRHLAFRRGSTLSVISRIAIVGVILGVAAMVSVLSVMEGFQEEFRHKVLGMNAHVLVMKYGIRFTEYREVREKVLEVDGVLGASPFIFHEMMLASGDRLSGIIVKGIDPSTASTVIDLGEYMSKGKLESLEGSSGLPPVVIGRELASRLKVDAGHTVSLVSPLRSLDPGLWTPSLRKVSL